MYKFGDTLMHDRIEFAVNLNITTHHWQNNMKNSDMKSFTLEKCKLRQENLAEPSLDPEQRQPFSVRGPLKNWVNSKVPRILHQTWKGPLSKIPPINKNLHGSWMEARSTWGKNLHEIQGFEALSNGSGSDWLIVYWRDEDIWYWIKSYHPSYLELLQSYAAPVMMADAIRYIILYFIGGVYADLDIGLERSLDPLIDFLNEDSRGLVVLPQTDTFGCSNDFMIASPLHPYLYHVISQLPVWHANYIVPYLNVFFSTGPVFLTLMYYDYRAMLVKAASSLCNLDQTYLSHNLIPEVSPRVVILHELLYGGNYAYLWHIPKTFYKIHNSWHDSDVVFYKFIANYWIILVLMIVTFALLLYYVPSSRAPFIRIYNRLKLKAQVAGKNIELFQE